MRRRSGGNIQKKPRNIKDVVHLYIATARDGGIVYYEMYENIWDAEAYSAACERTAKKLKKTGQKFAGNDSR